MTRNYNPKTCLNCRTEYTPSSPNQQHCKACGSATSPERARASAKKDTFRGTGLVARFLYSLPKPQAGYRQLNVPTIEPIVRDVYEQNMKTLANEFTRNQDPIELTLSEEARPAFTEFYETIELNLRPGGALAQTTDWASKIAGAVLRIAGLLHTASHGTTGTPLIDEETIKAAISIGTYFLAHMTAAFEIMSGRRDGGDARYLLGWAERQNLTKFSTSQVKRSIKTWDRERILKTMEVLINHGYARLMTDEEYYTGTGRHPGAMIELRPITDTARVAA